MKTPNPKSQISYGVMNRAGFWMSCGNRKDNRYERLADDFWPFKNERQATAAAKRVCGAHAVRRVITTIYEIDV